MWKFNDGNFINTCEVNSMEIYAITRCNHLCAMTVSGERAQRLKNLYGGQIEGSPSGGPVAEQKVKYEKKPIKRHRQGTKTGRAVIRSLSTVAVLMSLLLVWAVNDLNGGRAKATENHAGGPIVQTIPGPVEIPLTVPSAEPVSVTEEPVVAEQEAQVMPWAKSMECKVTFYDCCVKCCGKTNGITASGEKAVPHQTCAVDPKTIPLGTDVFIDYGDGELHKYRANDTGSGIKGARIDVCVGSHAEALKIGTRQATVYWNERVF